MIDLTSQGLQELKTALEDLQIPFCVVGSYASSARGEPRASMDIDLLARVTHDHAGRLATTLGPEWSVDPEAVVEALRRGRAFNIFYMPGGLKFDLFPVVDEFHGIQLGRATVMTLEGGIRCPVATAEDMVLAKLQWYRAGGEVSERQWRDIAGLLKKNRPLDGAYLRHWASRLRVDDLLSKASAEAGYPL